MGRPRKIISDEQRSLLHGKLGKLVEYAHRAKVARARIAMARELLVIVQPIKADTLTYDGAADLLGLVRIFAIRDAVEQDDQEAVEFLNATRPDWRERCHCARSEYEQEHEQYDPA